MYIKQKIYRKVLCSFLLWLLCQSLLFGQAESAKEIVISSVFEKYYNADDFKGIFRMLSPDMQKALPLVNCQEFLTKLKKEAGQIKIRKFIKHEKGFASYKTHFEKALFALNLAVDKDQKISGFLVKSFIEIPEIERNSTKMSLPFKGDWTVTWGGDSKELNYHVESKSQKNAFDFLMTDKTGKSFRTDGNSNEDFYAFGQYLFSPCDGEIVSVVDGIKENIIGEMNSFHIGGNVIILKTENNEYVVFCHLKHQSIQVKEGQKVLQGEALGQCGNTGRSSEPHLHFHVQNTENMNDAVGVKCYFDKIMVDGQLKTDYSPIKNERISQQ